MTCSFHTTQDHIFIADWSITIGNGREICANHSFIIAYLVTFLEVCHEYSELRTSVKMCIGGVKH